MPKGQLNLFYYIARQNKPTIFYYHRNNGFYYVWENYTNHAIGDHYDNSGRHTIIDPIHSYSVSCG